MLLFLFILLFWAKNLNGAATKNIGLQKNFIGLYKLQSFYGFTILY